jgi:uncharacterized membrane protein YdfJ with MMPL/SSD domain
VVTGSPADSVSCNVSEVADEPGLLSHAVSIPSAAPTLCILIGLGVGIDYALFIVTRHRTNIKAGISPRDDAGAALNTSGRAVLIAGTTVCIALLGMLVLRVSYISGLGIAAAVTVLFTIAAATTLLPALLGFLGMRVLSRKERRKLATAGPAPAGASGTAGLLRRGQWPGLHHHSQGLRTTCGRIRPRIQRPAPAGRHHHQQG